MRWTTPTSALDEIGALNTIRMDRDKWHGRNTDADGFLRAARRSRGLAGRLPHVDSRRRRIRTGGRGCVSVSESPGHRARARSRACRACRGTRQRRCGRLPAGARRVGPPGELHTDWHAPAHRSHARSGRAVARRARLRSRL